MRTGGDVRPSASGAAEAELENDSMGGPVICSSFNQSLFVLSSPGSVSLLPKVGSEELPWG